MSDTPNEEGEEVEVWRFRRYDFRARQFVTSIGKAQIAAIQRFGAETIPGSMECVPQHKLDGNGIYTPSTAMMSPAARRRLERLREQYAALLADEDHGRLDGWTERVELLSAVVDQIDAQLSTGTGLAER